MKLSRGAVVVLKGLTAIETSEHGVEMAVPAAVAASNAPLADAPIPPADRTRRAPTG